MRCKSVIIFFMVCLAVSTALARQKGAANDPAGSPAPAAGRQPMSDEDVQALRGDLSRMKLLVQQMETNLAYVDTTQTPLKHQFQLEIEMWKTVIRQMERRLPPANAH
jgi:hypothetical protein